MNALPVSRAKKALALVQAFPGTGRSRAEDNLAALKNVLRRSVAQDPTLWQDIHWHHERCHLCWTDFNDIEGWLDLDYELKQALGPWYWRDFNRQWAREARAKEAKEAKGQS